MENDSILLSLIESGAISSQQEHEILVQMHKLGIFDYAKHIKEQVANIRIDIENITRAEAIERLRETAMYLSSIADSLEDFDDSTADYEKISNEEENVPVINVIGGAV